MCLLFGCDYERQNREMVPVYSVLSVYVCYTYLCELAFICCNSKLYLAAWKKLFH